MVNPTIELILIDIVLQAKKAICDAERLDDKDWEKTYKGPAGGVITVPSEMGEPIHKLVIGGVRLWWVSIGILIPKCFSTNPPAYRAELDRTIFSPDKDKRLVELKKRRDYIIRRLSANFQKT